MELFHAHNQWASRPSDERFPDLVSMYDATKLYAEQAAEKIVPTADLRVEATADDDLRIVGKAGVPAKITHFAFGQLAARAGAPAAYLRKLPGTLAAQNLNHGLKANETGNDAALLFHSNGDLVLRAATTEKYSRIWNHEIVSRLIDVSARYDMTPARPTFSWGDESGEAPAADLNGDARPALFASDHDMFAFLMSRGRTIVDPMGKDLFRGVIVSNSEVGAASLKITGFNFRDVCQNFIIWGARDLAEVSLRHVGNVSAKWRQATAEIRTYLDSGATEQEAQLARAHTVVLGGTKEEVLDTLFGLSKQHGLSRKTLESGYDAVVPEEDGPASTLYGIVQGITRHSQGTAYADERNVIDRGAGKLLALTF